MSRAAALRPPGRRPRAAGLRRLRLPLLLVPLLAGCISEQREKTLGDQIAANVNVRVPLVHDVPLNLYVNELGRLLARHSERPDLEYHFYIVDTDGVNAFALPGGHIYVNRGLIERTRTVSELAGVLAHEIGHVAGRHGAKNLQRQMRTSSMSTLLYQTILGRKPLLDQQALQLGNQLWVASNSREDEAEADRAAVRYLIATGVDPQGVLSLLDSLLAEERSQPGGVASEWFDTHPHTARRVVAARANIAELLPAAKGTELAQNNASYPMFLRRLSRLPPPAPFLNLQ
ncbi:MAG TPA: M48 family metallopeptidase [Longimicrobiaceae bacterium]|nr:M48 family metallopeptidase [Longimicrobiaceae bacterium]